MVLPVDHTETRPGTPGVRRVLSVHAHPDDESSKGAGTVRMVVDQGGEALLVTCTGGEAGEVLNEAMRRPEIEADLPAVRMDELDRATDALGYSQVVLLGYRDSGMPDTPPNEHAEAFANQDFDVEVGRLVGIIRTFRPQVIITYGDDQKGYPHPDHLRVHDISVPAFDRAGDAAWYPDLGEPWTPLKLYYTMWSQERMQRFHEKFEELGLESPYGERWLERREPETPPTTTIDVTGTYGARKAALIAHATQIDPDSPFWFGLPDDVAETVFPFEVYRLAQSRVDTELPETDLFAGIEDLL
ncbi:MAG TPA: mycothiol conjugate amidase Mca [Acidimicrobiales bacterium]|nr:mycothiol conjugate amidase Mca [Acidimicrobiales bacterium]